MKAYEINVILNDIDENVERSIVLLGNITFEKLHEIICILFNLNEDSIYKFIFEDLGLKIYDTGTLNRDNIDSRFELIDKYLESRSKIKYLNSSWNLTIVVSQVEVENNYPQIIEIHGNYNPKRNCSDVKQFSRFLKLKNRGIEFNESLYLEEVNVSDIQERLLILFDIPYSIENDNITLLKKEGTLNNYLD